MLDINSTSMGLAKAESFNKNGEKKTEDNKLMEACQGFEALFMNEMMKQMRSGIIEGGLIQKSKGEEMFTEMLDNMYCENSAKSGNGFGMAELIYERMTAEKIATTGTGQQEDDSLIYRKKENPYATVEKASAQIRELI